MLSVSFTFLEDLVHLEAGFSLPAVEVDDLVGVVEPDAVGAPRHAARRRQRGRTLRRGRGGGLVESNRTICNIIKLGPT